MLSKKFRLQRSEIEELKSQKHEIIQGRFFGLIYKESDLPAKFGLIVSNKIASKATQRNKIKRLLYRAIEAILRDANGYFLFLAKKSSGNGSLEEFKKEMANFKNRLTT